MRHKTKLRLIAGYFIIVPALLSAQPVKFAEIDKKEGKIKYTAFEANEPAFKTVEISTKWNNESAVILYQKYDFRFLRLSRNIQEEETYRRRIRLMDKASVNSFSKIYWNHPPRSTGETNIFADNNNKFYVEINIVKPNGTVFAVDLSQAVEIMPDEYRYIPRIFRIGSRLKGCKKLAVPNLEPGDIIDLFYYRRIYYSGQGTYDSGPKYILLNEEYPVAEQKYSFGFENNFEVKLNSFNGAPAFSQTIDTLRYVGLQAADKVKVYTLLDKEREKMTAEPFSYEKADNPLIKFEARYEGLLSGTQKIKTGFTDEELIDENISKLKKELSAATTYASASARYAIKKLKGDNDIKKKCDELYYAVRFHRLNASKEMFYPTSFVGLEYYASKSTDIRQYFYLFRTDLDNLRYLTNKLSKTLENKDYTVLEELQESLLDISSFRSFIGAVLTPGYSGSSLAVFAKGLDKMKIPYRMVLFSERKYGDMSKVLFDHEHTTAILVEDGDKKYFYYDMQPNSTPDQTDFNLEGVEGITFDPKTYKKTKNTGRVTIPVSNFAGQKKICKTTIDFNPLNCETVLVDRVTEVTGNSKYAYSYLNFIDDSLYFHDVERYFGEKIKEKRIKSFKIKEEESDRLVETYKKLKYDLVKNYTIGNSTFGYTVVHYDTLIVLKNGRYANEANLAFEEKIKTGGLVAKLGENFSIAVGKAMEKQEIFDAKKASERKKDINIDFPSTEEYEITVVIPSGYKAEGIKDLNVLLDNQACSFSSTAEQVGGSMVIKTKKVFKHNFEKKENWQEVVDMSTAAYNFSQKKVILKKE